MKRRHDAKFKTKVVLAAIKEQQTMAQLSTKFEVHRAQIQSWKKHCLDNLQTLFSQKGGNELKEKDDLIDELYKQVGMLKIENDWLKKKSESFS